MHSPVKGAGASGDDLQKLQKRLDLLTGEYNKLVSSHSQLQRNYNLLNSRCYFVKPLSLSLWVSEISFYISSGKSGDSQEGFPARILTFIGTLLFNDKFSDMSIVFADGSSPIPCHSFVLDARGFSYDKDPNPLINNDAGVDLSKVISVPDASREIGAAMLRWMYTGKQSEWQIQSCHVLNTCLSACFFRCFFENNRRFSNLIQ